MTRDERAQLDALKREVARLAGWHRLIAWRCRGLAPELAQLATKTQGWADDFISKPKSLRRRNK